MKETALSSLNLSPLITTNSTKFLVPFILDDKNSVNAYGFVNAYIEDVNRPWLEDKIFLVYKTGETLNLIRDKLQENIHFHSSYWIHVNNEYYDVFVFNHPVWFKGQVSTIKNNSAAFLDTSSKMRITDFWNKNEYNVYQLLHNEYNFTNDKLGVTNDRICEQNIVSNGIEHILGIAS